MGQSANMRLQYLRVNPRSNRTATPCAAELQGLLACWRLNGVDAPNCAAMVSALASCSATAASMARTETKQLRPSINFLLNKMFKSRHL